MRQIRFYLPAPLAVDAIVELTDEAAHHAANVLRMKAGDAVVIFNGAGGEYEAHIAAISKKSVKVQIQGFSPIDRESPLRTHLAIALSKGDRFEQVLQKATELGVTTITPLITERTEVRLSGERLEKALLRWQKIITNACEQCWRTRLPMLSTPVELSSLLAREASAQKLILHPPQEGKSATSLDASRKPGSVCLLVGPEGGFSDDEVRLALREQFVPLALGPRILRTETAPLAALSVLQFVWGDFS